MFAIRFPTPPKDFLPVVPRGFTLMEVVLALAILSTLAVFIGTSTSRALKAKRKIQQEVADVSALRDTMKIIRADIHQIYNHVDFEKEITDQIDKSKKPTSAPGTPPPVLNPTSTTSLLPARANKREDPRTAFVGSENKINFVTMNNARLMASDIQADFVEVGYEVRGCKSLMQPDQTGQCLFRRLQKVLDTDVEKGGVETVVLEGVTEFSLRYLVEGKDDWIKEWKSIPQPEGDVKTGDSTSTKSNRSVFPDAVEVNLSIERQFDSKPRKYSLQYVVPLHFPNNAPASTNSQTPGAAGSLAAPPAEGGTQNPGQPANPNTPPTGTGGR